MRESKRVVAPHQQKLGFGSRMSVQRLPSPYRVQCIDLIRQLLIAVVRDEPVERREGDERED